MVNLTNEAWFGKTTAPYQALATSVFRAVENRVFVVRCANTGISCFIDPHGRVVDRVKDASGRELFVRGVLNGSVVPTDSKTIYTRYGDWFAWLCVICSVGFLVTSFFKKKLGAIKRSSITPRHRNLGTSINIKLTNYRSAGTDFPWRSSHPATPQC
jgi:apolipoprotein N-acyltransferase